MDRVGAGLGVERQTEDCAALGERLGWDVVDVYADNDISASTGKRRPQYQRLLDDIRSGRLDAVLVWHTDRLHRLPIELEEYITVCEPRAVPTATVTAGEMDLSTPSGRMVARTLGAFARMESEHKGERVRRARQQAAEAGKPNGRLGYGYVFHGRGIRQSIDPAQAAVVTECAARILAGHTLFAIATDLNDRGVAPPGAGAGGWRSVTLRQTMTRLSLAGYREWRPGASGHKGGRGWSDAIARGDWDPILDRDTVDRIRQVLSDPSRRTSRRQPQTLLTGVLTCGRCGAPLAAVFDRRTAAGRHSYRCGAQPGMDRCGRLGVTGPPVDAMVEAAVLAVLCQTRVPRRGVIERRTGAAEQELLAVRSRQAELAKDWAAGDLSRAEWQAARTTLEARIATLERILISRGGRGAALVGVPGAARSAAWWRDAAVDQKRVVVRALVEKVPIAPAVKSSGAGMRFDPSRVGDPVWRY